MKTNPFFFCLLSVLLISSTLFSRDVSINSARLVAKKIYFERFILNNEVTFEEIEFNSEDIITSNSTAVYYIFNVKNDGGFVIVSADDNLYPVLGYSFKGKYSDNNQPPAFSWLLDNYKQQILYAKENSIPADNKIRSAWSYYLSTNSKSGIKQLMNVSPLLSTTWDQGCYYNAQCPVNSSGPCGHVWAGCVATAMGQVMKYHSYPAQGTGSYSYYMPGYGTQSANYGNTTYDWIGMPNHLNGHDSTVAEFLYHCGVSVDMYYSTSGSGAMSYKVINSLISYFKYSGSAVMIYKSDYTNSNWENVLKNELDASRPIYYAGDDPSQGGHAFVCDGYQ
ncbi:MAG: C10 family peptidase, partial [Bacteroidia bacterium]|nr:C10 family peptidase [Bacteroidia bacterium]